MPLPKGDVHKKKEVVQDVTLHDLDVSNAKPPGTRWALSPVITLDFSLFEGRTSLFRGNLECWVGAIAYGCGEWFVDAQVGRTSWRSWGR